MLTSRRRVQRQQQHAGPHQGWVLCLKVKTFFFQKHLFVSGKNKQTRQHHIYQVFFCGIINRAPKAPGGKNRVFGRTKNNEETKHTAGRLNRNPGRPGPDPGFPGLGGPGRGLPGRSGQNRLWAHSGLYETSTDGFGYVRPWTRTVRFPVT